MPSSARRRFVSLLLVAAALGGPSGEPVWADDEPVGADVGPLLATRGIVAYRRGDLAGAVSLLRRAVALTPGDTTARHHLGLALIRLGRIRAGRLQLAAAARAASSDVRLLTDLGLAYLAEGNAAWGARTLERAANLSPHDGRLRYFLGVALLRLERPALALEELQAARRAVGVDRAAVAVQIGLAHYGAGRWASARAALDGWLWSERGAVARRLTRASHEAEGRGAALVSATLAAGGVVDSNPLYEHETSAPTAVGLSLDGRLVLRPWVDTRRILAAEIGAGRVFYHPVGEVAPGATDVRHASRTDLNAALQLSSGLVLAGRRAWLAAGYRFGLTLLDAPPGLPASPTLVDENHIFAERHAAALSLRIDHGSAADVLVASSESSTTLRYSLARQVFADLPRSHLANELLVEHLRAFGGRLRLLGFGNLRHEHADATDYHAVVPGLGAGVSYLGPWQVVVGVRVGYEYQDHYRSAHSGRWGQVRRRDHTVAATLEASRGLPLGMRLTAIYQRIQKESTVPSYDYGRDLATLSLSWSR